MEKEKFAIMYWLVLVLVLICLTVFLLELWTVLRKVPIGFHRQYLQREQSRSQSQSQTIDPQTIEQEPSVDNDRNVTIQETVPLFNRDQDIKNKIQNLVDNFEKEDVTFEKVLVFARATDSTFEFSEAKIYEPYIRGLVKKKISSWPYMTQLALLRHGRAAQKIILEEKENAS